MSRGSNNEVVCSVGEHHHRLAHQCSPYEKFAHTSNVKLNIMGIWKWGIYGLMGGWGGIYHLMGGTVMAKVSYFVWKYVKKMLVFGGGGPFLALEFCFVSAKF